jgi:hypothetical protein
MSAPRYYHANEQNQPVGPFTASELSQLREQALVTDDTLICVEDGSEWTPLSTLLRPSTPPSAGPPPVPAGTRSARRPTAIQSADGRTPYQRTAETIGLIPDLSGKRNLLQMAITIPVTFGFALYGFLRGGVLLALFWGFGGLLVAVLASGAVLMVLGWKKG